MAKEKKEKKKEVVKGFETIATLGQRLAEKVTPTLDKEEKE